MLPLGNRTRTWLETGDEKLRGKRSKAKPESTKTKNQAGARQAQESPAGIWKLGNVNPAEQVQTRMWNQKLETRFHAGARLLHERPARNRKLEIEKQAEQV